MANESLADWLDSLGYPIDEIQNARILDIFSGLSKWLENVGMHFPELGDSLKRVETLFQDESGFMRASDVDSRPEMTAFDDRNRALGEAFCERFGLTSSSADMDGFLNSPVSVQTVFVKLDMSASEESVSVNDTFVQFMESSVNRFLESGQYSQQAVRVMSDVQDSSPARFYGKSGELNEETDDENGRIDASLGFHLKIPPEDFTELNRNKQIETTGDVPVGKKTGFTETGKDSGDLHLFAEDRTVWETEYSYSTESEWMSSLSSTDVSLFQKLTNRILPGFGKLAASGRTEEGYSSLNKDEVSMKDAPFNEFLKTHVDKPSLIEKFFGVDAGMSGLDEGFMSSRQSRVTERLMDGQKLMDVMTLRQADETFLGLPDNPLTEERAEQPELSDAGASNRTINITVNGTGSSQETVEAISQGLVDVDMGMTLRHFKSPMMA